MNVSAKRLKGEHWTTSYHRVVGRFQVQDGVQTAVDSAVLYPQLDGSKAAEFTWGADRFESMFLELRDLRFLPDPDVSSMKRRLSWMYPDDGCFIRAEWMAKKFVREFNSSQVSKIFAFGDLNVKTRNSPSGKVSWWYHVVVGWKMGAEVTVYDPAIDPRHPLPLSRWVSAISSDPKNVKVAICGGGTYSPTSDCKQTKITTDDAGGVRIVQEYLHLERERLVELNRSPEKELADAPPWLKQQAR